MMEALRRSDRPGTRRQVLAENYGGNYLPVLICILFLYLILSLADAEREFVVVLTSLAFAAVVPLGALGAGVRSQRVVGFGLISALGALLFVLGAWDNVTALIALGSFLLAFLILIVQVVTLRDVVRQSRVTIDTILGSVVAYLLLSFIWAHAYLIMLRLDSQALVGEIDGEAARLGDTLYFSVVTLTTLGYGDIRPNSGIARTFVEFEALFGQLYIAVLVAWIVGRLVSRGVYHGMDDPESEASYERREDGTG